MYLCICVPKCFMFRVYRRVGILLMLAGAVLQYLGCAMRRLRTYPKIEWAAMLYTGVTAVPLMSVEATLQLRADSAVFTAIAGV